MAASDGKRLYSTTRSTEIMWLSTAADWRTPHSKAAAIVIVDEMASPTPLALIAKKWNQLSVLFFFSRNIFLFVFTLSCIVERGMK